MDVLDDVDSNDQINCYCGHTTMCDCQPLNAIEKAENDFIKSKIEEGEESGFDDIATTTIKQTDALEQIAEMMVDMKTLIDNNHNMIKLIENIVSVNEIALNHLEKPETKQ